MPFSLKYVVASLIFGGILGLITVLIFLPKPPPLEIKAEELALPLATKQEPVKQKGEVIGFYPYWNLSKVDEVDLTNLDTIYYFAVDLNGDGTWNTSDAGWSRIGSPNYLRLKELAQKNGTRWGLTIINLSADGIAKNINSQARQDLIITNTINLMKKEEFQDLNIDLEYVGEDSDSLTRNFTSFVEKMTKEVKKEIPGAKVSIDFFSDTYKRPRIFDLPKIGQTVDQVIIMGYDFHRLSSIKAGPIAPMFGKEKYQYDIASTVEGYLKLVSPEKLVLGVPFYGYEWPTESNKKGSFTIYSPKGPSIASYHRSIATAKEHNTSINFDDESKSVWFPYFDKDYQTWRQIWFENERSLGIKFDLVNDAKLNGIAIFALGYDGADAKPLWDEVKLKLH